MSQKRKRNVLSMADKVKIIELLHEGVPGKHLSKIFDVGTSTISDIKRTSSSILNFVLESEDGCTSRKMMRTARHNELETTVYNWYLEQKTMGNTLSGFVICEQAKVFAEERGDLADFQASRGWLRNFKARHGIQEHDVSGEIVSPNKEVTEADTFMETLKSETRDDDTDSVSDVYETDYQDETQDESDAEPTTVFQTGYNSEKLDSSDEELDSSDEELPANEVATSEYSEGLNCKTDDDDPESFNSSYETALPNEMKIKPKMRPTAEEAFTCFGTALKWMEGQSECDSEQFRVIKRLRDLAECKRAASSRKQFVLDMLK